MDEIPAARALARLARLLERAGSPLSFVQYRVLAVVAGGDQRATRLAECLAVAKPTVTAAVDGLVERGYVERQAVPGDRRSARITATGSGRRALAEADAAMVAKLEPLLARVPDRAQVVSSLVALGAALDKLIVERHGPAPAPAAGRR